LNLNAIAKQDVDNAVGASESGKATADAQMAKVRRPE
jgi:hypothetical protein